MPISWLPVRLLDCTGFYMSSYAEGALRFEICFGFIGHVHTQACLTNLHGKGWLWTGYLVLIFTSSV